MKLLPHVQAVGFPLSPFRFESFHPRFVPLIKLQHIIPHHREHIGGILAAVTATAVYSNGTLLIKAGGSLIGKMAGHHIDIDTTGYVAGIELIGGAHINKLHALHRD